MTQLCFFEDETSTFLQPLTLTRPVDDLRMGILKIHEKWEYLLNPEVLTRVLRNELKEIYPNPAPDDSSNCIWINSRYLPDSRLVKIINNLKTGEGLKYEDIPVVIKMSGDKSIDLFKSPDQDVDFISYQVTYHGRLLHQVTDIFTYNGEQIISDIELMNLPENHRLNEQDVTLYGSNPVYLQGDSITIEPNTTLNTTEGPIYIGDNATILCGSHIRGPVAIGEKTLVKMGAKIYKNTTIGPKCKAGGEINNVVFQGNSNKSHDGFLGNSVIGEWCNFGADSNNSNLKNNYSPVRLIDFKSHEQYDTGLQFCGTIMGDHCKTAINTNINTGSVFGVCCNIFTNQFPPKLLPSFTWLTDHNNQTHRLDKAIETASIVMKRRGVDLSDPYRKLLEYLFDNR